MTFGKNVEHFLVWLSSNLSKLKSPTSGNYGLYFIGTIVFENILVARDEKQTNGFCGVVIVD